MYLDEFTVRKLHESRLREYQNRVAHDRLVLLAQKAKKQLELFAPLRKRNG